MDAAWERTGRRIPPVFTNAADQPRVTIPPNADSVQWDLESPLSTVTSPATFAGGRVPTAATPSGIRRRDLRAQVIAFHGSREQLRVNVNANKQIYLKPISRSTARDHESARRLWLDYFAVALEPREGQTADEAAQATLEKGSKLPPLHVFQDFIKVCAMTGKSLLGVKDVTGWSYISTKKFTSCIFGMLHQQQVEDPTPHYREQVTKAIETWAKKDKLITTLRKPKLSIRLMDYIRVKGAIHNPKVITGVVSNFQRSQYSALNGLMFDLGARVGQFVEQGAQKGTNQVLRWGDSDFVIHTWDTSPEFYMFMKFHFMKGMKNDEGAITHTTLHTLSDKKAYYDTLLEIIAMACHLHVFEEDLESWIQHPHLRPSPNLYPYQLTVKEEFQKRAVFTSYEDPTKAMNYTTLQRIMHAVGTHFGWEGFTSRCFRYAWAGSMASKLGRAHMNYLMGHMYASNLARTTYQAPGRDKDTTALRHDENADMAVIDLHTSVAGAAKADTVLQLSPAEANLFDSDQPLKDAKTAYSQAEDQVCAASGGKTSMDLVDKLEDCSQAVQDLVEVAQAAWANLIERYCELKYASNPAFVSCLPQSSDRGRPAPLPSAKGPARFFNLNDLNSYQRDEELSGTHKTSTGLISMGEESLATLHLLQESHPLLPLVLVDPANAKINVIKHFLAKYSLDDVIKDLICGICANADVPQDHPQRTRRFNDTASLLKHLTTCEATFHRENYVRCNFCGLLIERGVPEYLIREPQDMEDTVDEDLNEHFAECYQIYAIQTRNWNPTTTDDQPGGPGPQQAKRKGRGGVRKAGSERASVFSRIVTLTYESLSASLTNWFCPLCLCDVTDQWVNRQKIFPSLLKMAEHVVSHGSYGGQGLAKDQTHKDDDLCRYYDMSGSFICRIPHCLLNDSQSEGPQSMSFTDMLLHYHCVHHIPLLVCTRQHEHADGDPANCPNMELSSDILIFEDDIEIIDDMRKLLPLIPPTHAAVKKSHRRAGVRHRQQQNLKAWLKATYSTD